jgi:hypothetical protein
VKQKDFLTWMVGFGTLGMARPTRSNAYDKKLNVPFEEEFDYVMPDGKWDCPMSGHSTRTAMYRIAPYRIRRGEVFPNYIGLGGTPQATEDAEKGDIVKLCLRGGQEAVFAKEVKNVRRA